MLGLDFKHFFDRELHNPTPGEIVLTYLHRESDRGVSIAGDPEPCSTQNLVL